MKYKIFAALTEDINSGWVWLKNPECQQRAIVLIKNPISNKGVFCEVLRIDDNFTKHYNLRGEGRKYILDDDNVLVINEWYRKLLGGLSTQSEYELAIMQYNNQWGNFMACIQHPQVVVRLATWLGVIGVALGVLGIILGLLSIFM